VVIEKINLVIFCMVHWSVNKKLKVKNTHVVNGMNIRVSVDRMTVIQSCSL
jgi:hypothetical protein